MHETRDILEHLAGLLLIIIAVFVMSAQRQAHALYAPHHLNIETQSLKHDIRYRGGGRSYSSRSYSSRSYSNKSYGRSAKPSRPPTVKPPRVRPPTTRATPRGTHGRKGMAPQRLRGFKNISPRVKKSGVSGRSLNKSFGKRMGKSIGRKTTSRFGNHFNGRNIGRKALSPRKSGISSRGKGKYSKKFKNGLKKAGIRKSARGKGTALSQKKALKRKGTRVMSRPKTIRAGIRGNSKQKTRAPPRNKSAEKKKKEKADRFLIMASARHAIVGKFSYSPKRGVTGKLGSRNVAKFKTNPRVALAQRKLDQRIARNKKNVANDNVKGRPVGRVTRFDPQKVKQMPKGVPFKGTLHRFEAPERIKTTWQAGKWNKNADHRYSKKGEAAIYGARSKKTAQKEVEHYRGTIKGRAHAKKSFKLKNALDLTNPKVRKQLNLTMKQIAKDGYTDTQAIGSWARKNGYDGIIAPSARDKNGINIVIFK